MKTENDIRKFVKSNAPEVGDSDRFMTELRRQIDLLPVPASLTGKSEEEIRSATAAAKKMAALIMRRKRLSSILAAVLLSVGFAALMLLVYFEPAVHDFVKSNALYLGAFVSAAVFVAAMVRLDRFRV